MSAPSLFDLGPPPACPQPFNMAQHTFAVAARDPGRPALEVLAGPGDVRVRLTHGAVAERVLRTAGGLARAGIGPGDRVLLRVGNTLDFPVLFFAANALGAVPVPTSPLLTQREVSGILADLDPRLVCVGEGLPAPDFPRARMIGPDGIAGLAAGEPVGFAETRAEDPAFIVYTSGTGGRPKGVVHAQRSAWARRMMWHGWYGLTPEDRVLHAGAFNWTYTLGAGLTDPWAIGAVALIHAGPADRHVWPRLAAAHGATIFAAAPGVYRQMLGAPDLAAGFAGLRHGLSAGEVLAGSVAARWSGVTGKPIYSALGMSEVSTYVSFAPGAPVVPGRAGRPQRGRRVAILGDEGAILPRGTEGDLAVSTRDPGLMFGYWDGAARAPVPVGGEWFVTGDRARMEEDDTITYLGRPEDLLNAGGFRVSAVEVEAVLTGHPGVREAAVIERAVGSEGASILVALYVPGEGAVDPEELARFSAERLARYKCPRSFEAVESLPRSANGKLLRWALA